MQSQHSAWHLRPPPPPPPTHGGYRYSEEAKTMSRLMS